MLLSCKYHIYWFADPNRKAKLATCMIFKGACVIMIKKMVVTIDGNGVIETHRKNALVIENITVDLTKKQNIIIYRPC